MNGVLSMSEVIYGFELGIVAVCSALGIISNALLGEEGLRLLNLIRG